jgi:hypothetical protein
MMTAIAVRAGWRSVGFGAHAYIGLTAPLHEPKKWPKNMGNSGYASITAYYMFP